MSDELTVDALSMLLKKMDSHEATFKPDSTSSCSKSLVVDCN